MGTLFKYVFRILLILVVLAFCFSFVFNRWIKKDVSGDAQTLAKVGVFENVDGVNYHLIKRGIGDKVFLLLHGYGTSSYTWNKEMDELANMGRVIAVDFPGFGYSDHGSTIDYRTEAEVQRLSDLLKQENVEKAIVIGHSYGGRIALALAQDHPDQIERLVLISPAVYHYVNPIPKILVSIPEISRTFLKLYFSDARIRQMYLNTFANPSVVTTDDIDNVVRPYQVKGIENSIIARAKATDQKKYDITQVTEIQTLILWGEKDKLIPRSDMEHLRADLASDPTLVTIPNVGHALQEEAPTEFMNQLKTFLAK